MGMDVLWLGQSQNVSCAAMSQLNMAGIASVQCTHNAFLVVLRLWLSNQREYLGLHSPGGCFLTLLSSLEIMTFVLTGAWVPDTAPGPRHGSHQSELCKVIRFVAAWINYSGRGRIAVTAQLSSLLQQVNRLSNYWWYPVAFLTKLIVWLAIYHNINIADYGYCCLIVRSAHLALSEHEQILHLLKISG